MKKIWKKEEIKIADELLQIAPKLREEFLAHHTDFDTTFKGGVSYADSNPLAILDDNEKNKWKVEGLRYALPEQKIERNLFLDTKLRMSFPTATALTEKYFSECGCSGYSILEPGGVIKPHVDIENRSHNTIRIHIPLIVPDTGCQFDVDGVKMDWNDLFGFDNGIVHSAINSSDKRRLIYIIDITRSFLGIEKYV